MEELITIKERVRAKYELIKNTYKIIHLIFSKEAIINKICVLGIILLFMITSFNVSCANKPNTEITISNIGRDIFWDVKVNFQETGGKYDYTVFGEAPNANDGPPVDTYDTMKPPPPIYPYLYAWFNDSLPSPYDKLTRDYRHYPDVDKTWYFFVQWVPSDYATPTTVTITWDSNEINSTEYTFVTLCTEEGEPLKNMLLSNSYNFSCPAMVPQGFKILCYINHPPYAPNTPFPFNGSFEILINTNLRWSGGDPDYGDIVTYDVYCGTTQSLIKIAANQSGTSHTIGPLQYNTKYYWKIVGWDTHKASNAGPLWSFTSKNDSTSPTVSITSPIKGYLYINLGDLIHRKRMIFLTTIIIGKIEVNVTAVDSQSGINRVEFYIDNNLKATDTIPPYSWTWSERGYFFPYILKVITFDCVDNQNSAEMRIWKIF